MAQNKPEKTTVQVEKLQERGGLQAVVNPGSLYSYDEARPAYVERPDDLRSNPWMQLSSALENFDAPLKEYTQKKQEEEMEQGIAQGGDLFKEYGTDPTTGNKLAWKEVIEKHPELAGKNPWIEHGHESARLQALGLDFKAYVQDEYTKSGMVNERDVNKVSQFMDKLEQDFRKTQGLNEFGDKVLLGETFSKASYEAKASIFNRHIEDMERQNLARTREQYTNTLSKTLSAIVDDPNLNASDPDAWSQVVTPRLTEAIQRLSAEASMNGLPATEVSQMVVRALGAEVVERGWEHGGSDILEIMQELDFGEGRLGDKPEVKEWVANTEDLFIRQQKADENQKRVEQERAETDAFKSASDQVARLVDKGQTVTLETIKKMGVRPQYWDNLLAGAESFRRAKEESSDVPMNGRVMGEYLQAMEDLSKGKKGSQWVLNNYEQFPRVLAEKLMNLALSEDKQNDGALATIQNAGAGRIWSAVTKRDPEDMSMIGSAETEGNPQLKLGYEAVQLYVEKLQGEADALREKKERNLSQYEMTKLGRDVERELLEQNSKFKVYGDPNAKPDASGGNTTTQQQQQNGGTTTPPPAPTINGLPADAYKAPLFGTQREFREALEEYKHTPDPEARKATKVGQTLTALNITDVGAGMALLEAQTGYYYPDAAVEAWWGKARDKVWEQIRANGTHPALVYGNALSKVAGVYAHGAKKLLGANQKGIKDVMRNVIER